MCFGNVAVPINNMNVGDADGNFKIVPMVELTSSGFCHGWFWKQLGVKYEDFKRGRHSSLPLVKEIKASIAAVRGKRKRDGKFYNEDGRPTPQTLVIAVRDKQLVVLTDPRRLVLGIGTKELMAWFVSELSRELRDAPAGALADEEDAEVDADAPGPVPIEDEGADEAQEPPAPGRELAPEVSAAIEEALKDLRSDPHIRSVRWDTRYGRFRMFLKEGPQRAIYVSVKQFNALAKGAHMNMASFSAGLAEAVSCVHGKARSAVAEVVPLAEHGEAA